MHQADSRASKSAFIHRQSSLYVPIESAGRAAASIGYDHAQMSAFLVLPILALLASPAFAHVYTNAFLRAEAVSVTLSDDKTKAFASLTVENTTTAPYRIVFLSAALKDTRGHFFDVFGHPKGIDIGKRYTCDEGFVLTPGAPLVIGLSFNVSPRVMQDTRALNLLAGFQAQRHVCEDFTVRLPNLGVDAE
jgi:hypothetical protein